MLTPKHGLDELVNLFLKLPVFEITQTTKYESVASFEAAATWTIEISVIFKKNINEIITFRRNAMPIAIPTSEISIASWAFSWRAHFVPGGRTA